MIYFICFPFRLVQSAHEDIHARGLILLHRITERMTVELKKYTEKFTQCNPDKKSVSKRLHNAVLVLILQYLRYNVLSTMSYQQCPINNVLSTMSYQQCPINNVLSTMSYQQCPINNVLSTTNTFFKIIIMIDQNHLRISPGLPVINDSSFRGLMIQYHSIYNVVSAFIMQNQQL